MSYEKMGLFFVFGLVFASCASNGTSSIGSEVLSDDGTGTLYHTGVPYQDGIGEEELVESSKELESASGIVERRISDIGQSSRKLAEEIGNAGKSQLNITEVLDDVGARELDQEDVSYFTDRHSEWFYPKAQGTK